MVLHRRGLARSRRSRHAAQRPDPALLLNWRRNCRVRCHESRHDALIATSGRCAAGRGPHRRNRARRRGKRSAHWDGRSAPPELLDQHGDARSGHETTERWQPRSPLALPASGHEPPKVPGVQSRELCSLLSPIPSSAGDSPRCRSLSRPFLLACVSWLAHTCSFLWRGVQVGAGKYLTAVLRTGYGVRTSCVPLRQPSTDQELHRVVNHDRQYE